jgi:GntR family transcriptional regulator
MAIETLHVRDSIIPGLTKADLEQSSFYTLLRERYGVSLGSALQTIEPTVTNEEESDALGVPLHSPAFLFERTTRSERGEIVEFVRSIYRGDRYRLVTELARGREPRRLALTLAPDASSMRP